MNNKDRELWQRVRDGGDEFVGTSVGVEEESRFYRRFEHT